MNIALLRSAGAGKLDFGGRDIVSPPRKRSELAQCVAEGVRVNRLDLARYIVADLQAS
jgi:hypothetical protein